MKHLKYIICSLLLLSSCNIKPIYNDKDIVILYTTDVHCAIDDKIGYSAVKAYKNQMIEEDNYVSLLDAGDFIQGNFTGAVSKGQYIVDIMNEMGYDIVTIGNHEFDYGMDALKKCIDNLNSEVISCNVTYDGNGTNKLSSIKPYTIKKYGKYKVGYVGVTTPHSLTESNPNSFKENGEFAYHFSNPTPEDFYNTVQSNIDEVNKKGVDYVILLTHLGYTETYKPYRSIDLINNTSGYDAVLDGHAHLDINWEKIPNKDRKEIPLCDAGYQLNEFGKLIIKKDGSIETDFITEADKKDEKVESVIQNIKSEIDEITNKVVGSIDVDLSIYDENSIRIVRSRETAIGNLIADAYRNFGKADIGVANGGGIRTDLKKGNVTYGQIKAVHPYGNTLQVKKTKGQNVLDYLEMAASKTEKEYAKDGKACGEFGGFASVSGLKYSIDTSIPSSVVTDANGEFVKIDGARRVKDVQVFKDGEYSDIDPSAEYTIASHNFLLSDGGDGMTMFVNDEAIESEELFDYEIVINYIVDVCKGKLMDKYSSPEGRITII